jgi:hypothetical protein
LVFYEEVKKGCDQLGNCSFSPRDVLLARIDWQDRVYDRL